MSAATPFLVHGDLACLTFHDHAEDANEPILCCCYGMVASTDNQRIVLESWQVVDPPECNHDLNRKRFVILRSAIIRAEKLTRRKVHG